MSDQTLYARAVDFASDAHFGQVRKYTGEPYVVHCIEVADLVRGVTYDPDAVVAAYLHDTVEDTTVTLADISKAFNWRVSYMVEMLTTVKREGENRFERKLRELKRIAECWPVIKTVKLADLISNTKDISAHDPDFAVTYIREKTMLMGALVEGNDHLFRHALKQINDYHKKVGRERRNANRNG